MGRRGYRDRHLEQVVLLVRSVAENPAKGAFLATGSMLVALLVYWLKRHDDGKPVRLPMRMFVGVVALACALFGLVAIWVPKDAERGNGPAPSSAPPAKAAPSERPPPAKGALKGANEAVTKRKPSRVAAVTGAEKGYIILIRSISHPDIALPYEDARIAGDCLERNPDYSPVTFGEEEATRIIEWSRRCVSSSGAKDVLVYAAEAPYCRDGGTKPFCQ